jgi:hypothetical protein
MRAVAFSIAFGGAALGLSACQVIMGATPGESARDSDLMRRAEPIIVALEKFHSSHGRYPQKLDELVPHYVADRGSLAAFRYGRWKRDYSLEFSYATGIPPFRSITHCIYDSTKKKWIAMGYQ